MLKLQTLVLLFALIAAPLFAQEYVLGPDSKRQPGVPEGKLTTTPGKARSSPAPSATTGSMSRRNTNPKRPRR